MSLHLAKSDSFCSHYPNLGHYLGVGSGGIKLKTLVFSKHQETFPYYKYQTGFIQNDLVLIFLASVWKGGLQFRQSKPFWIKTWCMSESKLSNIWKKKSGAESVVTWSFFNIVSWDLYWWLLFLSPPVPMAPWALMHHFLSVCLSGCLSGCLSLLQNSYWTKIHILGHMIGSNKFWW